MRSTFVRTLVDMASRDEKINLVVGDLGFGVVEPFAEAYPERFLNAGVAEQNMTGIAAGMALCGKTVFTYSIANFPTLRCLEQIRNDICYHNVSVKIVSVGGGLGYGSLGVSHHATEDIAVMRALPNMTVVSPCDPVEVELATRALAAQPGPGYLRLGRSGEPTIHREDISFTIGKAITVRDGEDVCFITTGGLLPNVMRTAELLSDQGIEVRVLSMHTIKPLDEDPILAAARETHAIFSVEEHSILGGLGSAVAEVLAESTGARVPFKRLGLPPTFTCQVGSHDYLLAKYSLSPEGILASLEPVLEILQGADR